MRFHSLFLLAFSMLGFPILHTQASDYFRTNGHSDNAGNSKNVTSTIPTFLGETYNCDVDVSNDGAISDGGIKVSFSNAFITQWETTSANESITIPTTGSGYNYTIFWGDGMFSDNQTGDATHTYIVAGTYEIQIFGDFPRIYFNDSGDRTKIKKVLNWGNIAWNSMQNAFYGCKFLTIEATDSPNLSSVSSMKQMFRNCTQLSSSTDNFNTWDVSHVTSMYGMFLNDTNFNEPLDNWNVSNVTSTEYMFENASKFNQDISSWNTAPSSTGNFVNTFSMFRFASKFNQDISNWDMSQVKELGYMFDGASSFNQPIGSWNVNKVKRTLYMFQGAAAFDQDISNWNISAVIDMTDMFNNAGLSTTNYDNALIAWSNLSGLESNISFNGGNSNYCAGADARASLINNHGWTISDGGLEGFCANVFITEWETTGTGESITIPTTGSGYDYTVNWGDGTEEYGKTGNATHTYAAAGTYEIQIYGDFPRIYFNDSGDRTKIKKVLNWGNIAWTSMQNAFYGCKFLTIEATDSPNLSSVSIMDQMFKSCTHLSSNTDNFNTWDVSHVTSMFGVFFNATNFNEPLDNWNVSNVAYPDHMFENAINFNQDISSWNTAPSSTGNFENTAGMFRFASNFNQDISNWDMGQAWELGNMFDGASSFNQPIGSWNVDQAKHMNNMFQGATAFDQDISDWNISAVTNMTDMFKNAGLSTTNYDNALIAWSSLSGLQSNISFNAGNSNYCQGAAARCNLINNSGWTITDDGKATDCTGLYPICPSNMVVANDAGICGAVVDYSVNYSPCDGETLFLIFGNPSGSTFPLGTTHNVILTTDSAGNSGNCFFNIKVEDHEAPNAVCRNASVVLDANGEGSISANDVDNGSSDACSFVTSSLSQTNFTCSDVGSNVVTLTASDIYGNAASCTAIVTVEDNEAPNAICKNATVKLNSSGNGTLSNGKVNNGSSDNCGIAAFNLSQTAFTCSDVGSHIVTLTVFDGSNNNSSCIATVMVEDTTKPNARCRAVTLQLDGSGNATLSIDQVDNGSSDACGIAALSLNISSFDCSNVGTQTVELKATDVNGNSRKCAATITIEDNDPPTALCRDVTVQLDANGEGSISANDADNGSSDVCGIVTISFSQSSFTCSNVGSNVVTLIASDVSGNAASCAFIATVEDNEAPNAICKNATVALNSSGNGTLNVGKVNKGSNDNCGIASYILSQSVFTCSDVGSHAVTLTVSDDSNNSNSCTATVSVIDTIDPNVLCKAVTLQLDDSGNAILSADQVDNGSSDACGIAALSLNINSFDCSNIGTQAVVLKATDQNGNTKKCTATITIEDNLPPTTLCQDVNVQLDDIGNGSTSAMAVDNGSSDACGMAMISLSQTSFTCSNVGSNVVTLTATDIYGNAASCTAIVTVEEDEAPTAICKNATVALNASGNGTLSSGQVNNGSTDNCGIATFSLSTAAFTCSDVGSHTVTLTAFDVTGNTGTCTATITVEDNVRPNIHCKNVTIQLDSSGNATLSGDQVGNGSTDACGIDSFSLSKSSFNCNDVGTRVVVLIATDVNGNTEYCTATIKIRDYVPPTTLCQDVTVQLDDLGNGSTSAVAVDNGSSDACGMAMISLSQTSFTCSDVGSNVVTLTASDINGNEASCTATVTVEDKVPPTAACKPATVYLDQNGVFSISSTSVDNGSNDACGIAGISLSQTNFDCSDVGTIVVTLTATDNNNNSSTCTNTITVVDNSIPTPLCQVATVQLDANGNGTLSTGDVDNGSADNCGINALSLSQTNFTCADVGINSVTLMVTDASGNTATCSTSIVVEDSAPPTAICQDVTVQLDENGTGSISAMAVDNGSDDACGIAVISLSQISFSCSDVGSNIVVLTASDVQGNSASCTATVTVEDHVAPTALCQNVTVQLDANGHGNTSTEAVDYGSNDACGINELGLSESDFSCSNVGTNVVTLTVTDANNNTATCTATITVEDNVAPTALCQNLTVQLDSNGNGDTNTGAVDNGSNDACGIAGLSLSQTNFDCSNIGTLVLILTATDNNSNTATCIATISVEDNVAPVALCQNVTVQLDANGSGSTSAAFIDNGSNDACGVSELGLSQTSFTCADVGVKVITLTVTDVNNNTATCTATITVEDHVAPTALCQNVTVQLDANGHGNTSTEAVDNGSNDACGMNELGLSQSNFSCSNVGANVVTLTVTDVNSNTATCTATITVEDNVAPTALCQNVTVQLDANGHGNTSTEAVDNGSNDACGIAGLSLSQTNFDCSNVGTLVLTLTATDNNSNTATCIATINVEDNVAPVALCQNVTVQLDANGSGSTSAIAVDSGSNDACGINDLSISQSEFTCFNLGTNVVTLIATDVNNNSSTCTATITVVDLIAPTLQCKPTTIFLDANGQAMLTAQQVNDGSFDNCSLVSLSVSPSTFTCAQLGNNTVELNARDQSGNKAACSATVTVVDAITPVAACKNIFLNLGISGTLSVAPGQVDNGSSDNCSFGLALSPNYFDCSNIGVNIVTLKATDAGGNSASCSAVVTIRDLSAPQANCRNAVVYLDELGQATLNTWDVDNGSFDNCGISYIALSKTDFNCSEIEGSPWPVWMSLRDANGNSSSCLSYITVKDVIAPTAVCENTTVALGSNGYVVVYPQTLASNSTDNCSVWSYSPFARVYNYNNLGENALSITVRDYSGNAATCTAIVTVVANRPVGERDEPIQVAETPVADFGLRVYPNPTVGDAMLEFELPTDQDYRLVVRDMSGRVVLHREGQGIKGQNSLPIAMGNVAPGVYLLELRSEKMFSIKRLIVQEK